MKQLNLKKSLGLAIGEKSLFAAEVVAGPNPRLLRGAEFVYPSGITPAQPTELGKALAEFLRQNQFTAKSAVVGLPLKWLALRPRQVPPSDPATLAQMLRLSAETEFSTELKDLVFDFAGNADGAESGSVTLVATQRKYLEWVESICNSAGLEAVAVTATALALDQASGISGGARQVVVSLTGESAELSAGASIVRSLRASSAQGLAGELRRAVSALPPDASRGAIVLWDGGTVDAGELGKQLGVPVRGGVLSALGVETANAEMNGHGNGYAPAVSLAVAGIGGASLAIDYLHSRLAPPKVRKIPRWAQAATAIAVVVIGLGIYGYVHLLTIKHHAEQQQATLEKIEGDIDDATDFVNKVTLARAWHTSDPRYLACVLELSDAIPDDGQTYATSLILKEIVPAAPTGSQGGQAAKPTPPVPQTRALSAQLVGKTSDQQHFVTLFDRLKRVFGPSVKSGGTQETGVRVAKCRSLLTLPIPPVKRASDREIVLWF